MCSRFLPALLAFALTLLAVPCAALLPAGTPPPGAQSRPTLVRGPYGFLTAWTDDADPSRSRIFWSRFQGPPPTLVASPVSAGQASQVRSSVAATAAWSLCLCETWPGTGYSRVEAAELPVTGPPRLVQTTPVTSGGHFVARGTVAVRAEVGVMIWEDERDAPGDLYLARWDRGVGLRDAGGIPFAVGTADQRWPSVAATAGGFLVAWAERPDGEPVYRIRLRELDSQGEPSGAPVLVSPTGVDAGWPHVAAGPQDAWVAWSMDTGGGDLQGRRVCHDGTPLTAPVTLAATPDLEYSARLAVVDSDYVLVWLRSWGSGREARRALVDPLGGIHPTGGIPLSPPSVFASDLAVAAQGDSVWAVWREPLGEDEDDLVIAGFAGEDTVSVVVAEPLVLEASDVTAAPDSRPRVALRAAPNPFRGSVRLWGSSPKGTLRVFDVRGARIREVSGIAEWIWDGRDEGGRGVAPGVYYVRDDRGSGIRVVRLP